MLLLYLDHVPLELGKSVREGVRSTMNQPRTRRAGLGLPHTSVGNHASNGQPAHKYNKHLYLRDTLQSVAYHITRTVAGVASFC